MSVIKQLPPNYDWICLYVNEVPIVAAVRLDVDLCDEAAGLVGRRVDDALGPRPAVHVIDLKTKKKFDFVHSKGNW